MKPKIVQEKPRKVDVRNSNHYLPLIFPFKYLLLFLKIRGNSENFVLRKNQLNSIEIIKE
jgi:hypothetical protein